MKKYLLICFSLLALSSSLIAQSWLWGAQATGTIKANDNGCAVATDRAGNAYLAGDFGSSIKFGPYNLTCYSYCAYLAKYNSAGIIQWATQPIQQSNGDVCNSTSLVTDKKGNVLMSGDFDDSIKFGSFTLVSGSYASSSVFLAKYNSNGSVLLATAPKILPLASGAQCFSVTTDLLENIYITGYFHDSLSFGSFTLRNNPLYNGENTFLVKYDSSGNVLWAKQSNTSSVNGNGFSNSVTTDKWGNIYLTGMFSDTVAFGIDTLRSQGQYSFTAFLVKYNANGNVLWAKQAKVASNSCYGFGNSVVTDGLGAVYIGGWFVDTVTFGSYALIDNSNNYNSGEMFLAKYDSTGNVLWAEQSSRNTTKFSIHIKPFMSTDSNNHIYMAFIVDSTLSFGGYTFNEPISDFGLYGPQCIAELNDSGKVICGSIYMNVDEGGAIGIASDQTGKYIYLGGTDADDTLFFGSDTLIPKGGGLPYIARWQPCKTCSLASAITGIDNICLGSSDFLSASGGTSYLWSNGETTSTVNVEPSLSTYYTVMVTNGNCSAVDSFYVSVYRGPIVNTCCSASINPGQSVNLNSTGGVNYSWTPSSGLSCTNCPNPTASPVQTTTYYVTVTTDSGCSVIDAITIDVNCGQVFIPDAFSPNGDGQNDVFYLKGDCIKSMDFVVYDRWGNKVFESQNINTGWDGNYMGKPMNAGTYVYYLKGTMQDGSTVEKHGNITLVR